MDAGTTTDLATTVGDPGGGGGGEGEEDYIVTVLAVSIPCGVVILTLVIIIAVIVIITLRSPSSDIDEVEATYMRRRFQGLSLEEQRRIAAEQKQKRRKSERFKSRRSSSATESSNSSSIKLTPYSKRAKVRQGNPFKLQEWQLRMTGIDISPDRETDYDDESYPSSPIGALNPLMLENNDEITANYETAEKGQGSKPANEEESSSLGEGGSQSSSSDSMNPYD